MIRKHFRIRRIVIGLAFAAIAAPAAQAYTGLTLEGPTRGVASHQRIVASEISVQPAPLTQAQVAALRYQAMVDLYSRQAPVRSENSFGVPGPSAAGAQGPSAAATTSVVSSRSFDWRDAGIGGLVVFGAALMVLTAMLLGRRHRSLASV
jgi:hypothetical protein